MRQQGCRQCEQITSGDCGQHGTVLIGQPYPVLAWAEAEIARLRAEVERLTGELREAEQEIAVLGPSGKCLLCSELKRKRDKALKEIERLRNRYESGT